jgi:hypothetical protein
MADKEKYKIHEYILMLTKVIKDTSISKVKGYRATMSEFSINTLPAPFKKKAIVFYLVAFLTPLIFAAASVFFADYRLLAGLIFSPYAFISLKVMEYSFAKGEIESINVTVTDIQKKRTDITKSGYLLSLMSDDDTSYTFGVTSRKYFISQKCIAYYNKKAPKRIIAIEVI